MPSGAARGCPPVARAAWSRPGMPLGGDAGNKTCSSANCTPGTFAGPRAGRHGAACWSKAVDAVAGLAVPTQGWRLLPAAAGAGGGAGRQWIRGFFAIGAEERGCPSAQAPRKCRSIPAAGSTKARQRLLSLSLQLEPHLHEFDSPSHAAAARRLCQLRRGGTAIGLLRGGTGPDAEPGQRSAGAQADERSTSTTRPVGTTTRRWRCRT